MSDILRAYREKVRTRCDRCGRLTDERSGAYRVISGPTLGTFCTSWCYEKAANEMKTGKLNDDTLLPETKDENEEI